VQFAKKSLLAVLVALALIACQRAPAAATVTLPTATPTNVPSTPTLADRTPTATPLPLLDRSVAPGSPSVASEVPRITPEELKDLLYSARYVVVIDTRAPDDYEAAHVRGAINVPYDQVEFVAPQLPRTAKIVLYCA
jgi:hypothetical protein